MAGGTETDADVRSLGELLDPRAMPFRHKLGLVGLAVLAVLPFFTPPIRSLQFAGALFFATFVISWDFVSGYTGEISFGHGLFYGVGGYTAGMLNLHAGVDPYLAVPIGAVAAALAGLTIGFPSLRLHGPYFSLITLVAPIIVISIFRFYPEWTGGELGLISVGTVEKFGAIGPIPSPGFDPTAAYYAAFVVFSIAMAVFMAVTRSDAGVVLTAIREDEVATAATGKNPAKYKLFAFVLSGLIGGFAGAAYGFSAVGSFTPSELLALVVSIEVIIAAILGGIGTISGAAVGGMVFYLLQVVLRNADAIAIPFTDLRIVLQVPFVGTPISEFDFLIFAVITLGFLFFLPQGIVPRLILFGRSLLGSERPEEDEEEPRLWRILRTWFEQLPGSGGDDS
jgi:branched-chain amino acid transport system permease protein